jgi:TolB-like protein
VKICRQYCFALLVVLLGWTLTAHAGPDSTAARDSIVLAILPFANYTGDPAAANTILPLIAQNLDIPNVAVAEHDATRDVLRRHRIRAVGGHGPRGASALSSELGTNYVITGSIDRFEPGAFPEAGLTVRLTSVESLEVVWSQSVGATGLDFESALGLGRVDTISALTGRLVASVVGDLREAFRSGTLSRQTGDGTTVAVVEFDDLAVAATGGRIATAHVISHLVARGYRVVDPGTEQELFLQFRRVPRGSIDYELLGALHDSLGADYVITGSVDEFHQSSSDTEESYPRFVIGGRLLDTRSGRIVSVANVARDGDREIVFGLGGIRSSSRLVHDATSSLLDKLDLKEGRLASLR